MLDVSTTAEDVKRRVAAATASQNPFLTLADIVREYPEETPEQHGERFIGQALRSKSLNLAVLKAWTDRAVSTLTARRTRALDPDAITAAAKLWKSNRVTKAQLDTVLSNGKAVRDCTGKEIRTILKSETTAIKDKIALTGFLSKVVQRVGPREKVGSVIAVGDPLVGRPARRAA